jgi:hypothetical protein
LNADRCFTIPGVWAGGHHQLKICLGSPSDARINEALASVWESYLLKGPYQERDEEPPDQPRVSPIDDHLFGMAQISGSRLPFGAFVIREEDQRGNRLADFVDLYLPLGGLATIYPIGSYSFGSIQAAKTWRPEVDAWFVHFLRGLNRPFAFQIGVVGFEVQMTAATAPGWMSTLTAGERLDGIILPGNEGVEWHPPTSYES